MTGPEHYREAENLLAMSIEQVMGVASGDPTASPDGAEILLAAAQVHATLAAAAAVAMNEGGAMHADDSNAWFHTASEAPAANRRRKQADAEEYAEFAAAEAEHEADEEERQRAHDEYLNDRLAEDGRYG